MAKAPEIKTSTIVCDGGYDVKLTITKVIYGTIGPNPSDFPMTLYVDNGDKTETRTLAKTPSTFTLPNFNNKFTACLKDANNITGPKLSYTISPGCNYNK